MLGHTTTRISRTVADDQLSTSLLAQMLPLRIRDPMNLDDFMSYTAEANTEIEALNATALPSKYVDDGFLFSAQDSSDFTELESTREGVINSSKRSASRAK